jgi:Uma2 family endonuclease
MSRPRLLSQISTNEFMASPAAQSRSELVRGEVRVLPPATGPQARVSGNVTRLLTAFVNKKKLGRCFDDSAQFELPNLTATVRMPDASFVRADRIPLGGSGGGWLAVSPDLAVEVLSPKVLAVDLEEKLADYRAAGTTLVWVVNPERRRVSVIAAGAPLRFLLEPDTLDGADVLPGFSCSVSQVLEGV